MGDLLGISIDWGGANPDFIKQTLKKQFEHLGSQQTQLDIDTILNSYGKEFIQNFDPTPIDDAIKYVSKVFALNNMYRSLFGRGINYEDCCSEKDRETAETISQRLGAYLKSTLDCLVKDVKDNERKLLELSGVCGEHTLDKEEDILLYSTKIGKIFEIEEFLLGIGDKKDYIDIETKTLLLSLKSRIDTYKNNMDLLRNLDSYG